MLAAAVRRPLAIGALAVAALAVGIAKTSWPWLVDDAFISLRYAERLAAGEGLTWTAGERVEGYSNLLWVLLIAGLQVTGIDGLTAVRALGALCTVATFAVLLGSRLLPAAAPARLAVVVAASLAATATWTIAGLETPLVLLLLAAGFANVESALAAGPGARAPWWRAGIAFALLSWTRPEAPLWLSIAAITSAAGTIAGPGDRVRLFVHRLGRLLGPALLAVGALLAFRLAYYGEWLPNTAYAKLGSSPESRATGLRYVIANAVALRALLLPAGLGLLGLLAPATRRVVATAACGAASWWCYVLLVGGDTFPRGRLLLPALVPLVVLAAHGFAWLAARGRGGRITAWLAAVACVALAQHDAHHRVATPTQRLTDWEYYGRATGEWLAHNLGSAAPLLAVDAAGSVPYFSKLPCLDMLGLCDHTIARTPAPAGHGFVPGHSRANGPYVLSRRPDLVMFGLPPGSPQPQWPGGRQMEAEPTFLADYRVVLFEMPPAQTPRGGAVPERIIVWTRIAGRIGLQPGAGASSRLRLPGFWLASYRQPYSFLRAAAEPARVPPERLAADMAAGAAWLLDPGVVGLAGAPGELPVAAVRRAGRHRIAELPLAAGRYRLTAGGPTAGITLELNAADDASLADGNGAWRVPAPGAAAPVDLVCTVAEGTPLPVHIRHFEFERIGPP